MPRMHVLAVGCGYMAKGKPSRGTPADKRLKANKGKKGK